MGRRQQPRRITAPTPGFYTVRLAKGGWQVPALIAFDGTYYFCSINGEAMPGQFTSDDIERHWITWLKAENESPLIRIICHGEPCSEEEWDWRNSMREWAMVHMPEHPCCHPLKAIDVRLLPASADF